MKKISNLSVLFAVCFYVQSAVAQTVEIPLLKPAADVSSDRFTAQWYSVPSADSYSLEVWTVDTVRAANKLISSTAYSSPNSNWVITNSGTSNTDGGFWYFTANSNHITSPAIDFSNYTDSVELTVKARTYNALTTNLSVAIISIYVNGVKVDSIAPATNTLANYSVTIPVSGLATIQLKTENANGTRGAGIAAVSLQGNYTAIMRNPAPNSPFSTTDTFCLVAGLREATDYCYAVTAIKGASTATSAEAFITTLSFLPPTLLEAKDVQFDRFTACWHPIPIATSYRLDVWTADTSLTPNKPISATTFSESNNWIIDSTRSLAGYWILTSPIAKVTSPVIDFSDYTNVTLTVNARTFNGVTDASADISVYVNTAKVTTITPTTTSLTDYTVSIPVAGSAYIQLVTEDAVLGRGVGIAAVSLQGDYTEIARYPVPNSPFATTDTFHIVAGLQAETAYQFAVSATHDSSVRVSAIGNIATLPLPAYTLSASCGEDGRITPSGDTTVMYGDRVSYTILADTDYRIDSVFIDDRYSAEATVNGTYTFANICDNHTIHATFTPFALIGVRERQNIRPLKVYAHRRMVCLLNEPSVPIQSIQIWDLSGRLLSRYSGFRPQMELDLPDGMYIVQITDANRQSNQYKIVVQ